MHVVYEFGTFRLDPRRRLLEADGAPIHVTAKALDALVYLVLHDGELVQRSALIDALWPDTVVEENNLNQAISSLRRALGDGFIATVPGRGYQFIAEVRMTAGAPEPASAPTSTSALADVYDVATAFSPARRPSQTFRRLGSLRRGVPWRWAAVGAVVIVATAAVVGMLGQVTQNAPADAERPVTFFVDAPQGSTFGMAAGGPYPALSSDGRSLAFVAPFEKRHVVWIQTLGDLDARPLEGTEGAALPFWSPDGRFVGFAADGRLKRIATSSGGAAQDLSAAASYWGGTWSPKGAIVFAAGGGLYRVPSGGGKASPLTRIDTIRGELSHRFPVMLPDGTRFLYLALSSQEGHQGLYLGSLEDPQMKRRIVRTSANGAIGRGPDGHLYLFFVRDLVLFAQPFDAERGELTGTAAVVGRPIEPAQSVRLAPFTVSERTLVYRPRFRPNTRLIWMDRRGIHGERLGVEGESYRYPSLSPDGTKLAVSRLGRRAGRHDVWWFDLRRGVSERLTADPVGAYVPAWTPDASRVVYSSAREDRWGLYWRPVARRSEESPLLTDQGPPQKYVREVTRDGRFVLFQGVGVDGSHDLWVLPLAEAGTPYRLMETPFAETHGRVSPDGRWLAFTSDETGELQVYVTTFPEPTERWRVSTDGGSDPQWRADGRELYYLAADAMLMAADVGSGATFSAGVPEPLFRMFPDPVSRRFGSVYAAAPDGQRFVVTEIDDDEDEEPRLVVTLNWMAERF